MRHSLTHRRAPVTPHLPRCIGLTAGLCARKVRCYLTKYQYGTRMVLCQVLAYDLPEWRHRRRDPAFRSSSALARNCGIASLRLPNCMLGSRTKRRRRPLSSTLRSTIRRCVTDALSYDSGEAEPVIPKFKAPTSPSPLPVESRNGEKSSDSRTRDLQSERGLRNRRRRSIGVGRARCNAGACGRATTPQRPEPVACWF
jgi:hypothetical protein